nr:hypothetical protein [Methanobrevibacter arboriphilus]
MSITTSIQKITVELPKIRIEHDKKELSEIVPVHEIYERPISVELAKFVYDKNKIVANAIKIKKEDIILNNTFFDNSDEYNLLNKYIIKGLEYNKEDLAHIVGDHELYGAGCGVIRQHRGYIRFEHLKQENITVISYAFKGKIYPIVINVTGEINEFYKMDDYYYPDDFTVQDKKIESVLWFGGGQFNSFYSYPFYFQALDDVNNEMVNKKYDKVMLENGNLISGFVYMNQTGVHKTKRNVNPTNEEEEGITSQVLPQDVMNIKNRVENAGFGNVFLYGTSKEPLTIDYVKLSNDNYDYLIEKLKDIRTELMSAALIPQERFMITNIKESMNSHKTSVILEYFTYGLRAEQNKILSKIKDSFMSLLNYRPDINLNVPIIYELVQQRLADIREDVKIGLITLREGIEERYKVLNIQKTIPDNTNPLLDERYTTLKPLINSFDDTTGAF